MRGNELVELARLRPVIADGAMGTMLQQKGLEPGACPELWNIEHADVVRAIYEAYIAAGSEVISTNTFGCNRIKLRTYGLENRAVEINSASVRIAKGVAGEQAYVMGSIGPTGHFLEPYGDLTFDDAISVFHEQALAMAQAGADVILLETFSDILEVKAGLAAALKTGIPCFCTMAFDSSGRTMMGVSPARAATELTEAGATGVGANCGTGPTEMLDIVRQMRAVTKAILIAQPNAGVPRIDKGQVIYDVSPEEMAEYAQKFVDAGVNIIGACCGSTPEHIKAIRKALAVL